MLSYNKLQLFKLSLRMLIHKTLISLKKWISIYRLSSIVFADPKIGVNLFPPTTDLQTGHKC